MKNKLLFCLSLILVSLFSGRMAFANLWHETTGLTISEDNSSMGEHAFLIGSNSYHPGTVINGGILTLSNNGTLGASSGSTTITNGKLELGGTTQTQGLISLSSGDINNGNIANTEVLFMGGFNEVSANIVGASSVVSVGGSNALTGMGNNYTGGTFLTNGLLAVYNGSSLGSSSNALSINNARLNIWGERAVLQDTVTIANGSIISMERPGSSIIIANTLNLSGSTNYFWFDDIRADNQPHLIMTACNGIGDFSKLRVMDKNPNEYGFTTNNNGTELFVTFFSNGVSEEQDY